MGQEFFINSQELENKIRQLLPSQGGAGAGFDLSASTQIIPIIDLTESAQGSNLRQDLQTSMGFDSITPFSVENTTTTIINNTGFYRVFGACSQTTLSSTTTSGKFVLNDGTSDKIIVEYLNNYKSTSSYNAFVTVFDFIVFLKAGDSLKAVSSDLLVDLIGNTRQIATIDGELVSPI